MTAVYTSANLNYLAKARTLAQSVKRHNPDTRFYLLLVDSVPDDLRQGVEQQTEPFDVILTPEELNVPDFEGWMFGHSVVEACTAVKAAGLVHLLNDRSESCVLYLDPDVVVFDSLDVLFEALNQSSILLTPHCPVAETRLEWIIRNEISSLAHGTFNLGFIGVAADDEGRRFAQWWQHRLRHFCHDDIPRGLFTDQRWIDLVPGQFEQVTILRDPIYNAATWNVTQREISGSAETQLLADGRSLTFYHFSGIADVNTRGAIDHPGVNNAAVEDLNRWYFDQCVRNGDSQYASHPWKYATYDDGQQIRRSHRLLYRSDEKIQQQFPHPFRSGPDSYLTWLKNTQSDLDRLEAVYGGSIQTLRQQAESLYRIQRSLPYRLYTRIRHLLPRSTKSS